MRCIPGDKWTLLLLKEPNLAPLLVFHLAFISFHSDHIFAFSPFPRRSFVKAFAPAKFARRLFVTVFSPVIDAGFLAGYSETFDAPVADWCCCLSLCCSSPSSTCKLDSRGLYLRYCNLSRVARQHAYWATVWISGKLLFWRSSLFCHFGSFFYYLMLRLNGVYFLSGLKI